MSHKIPRSFTIDFTDEPASTQDPDIVQDDDRVNLIYEVISGPAQLRRLRGNIGPILPTGTLVILDNAAAKRPVWFAGVTGTGLGGSIAVWES